MAPHSPASLSPKPESVLAAMDESASSQDMAQGKQPEISALRFSFLALGVCLGLFLSFIDTSIVATSLFSIGTDFGNLDQVNWVAISYTLAYMGLSVFFARISDVVGRRDAFLAAYVIFFAFSIGCGFAQNMHQLIACRTLQGIGGSGLYSLTMIILIELSPVRFRAALATVVGVVMAIGGVLGPVLGGILTHYATWRWVFWINGPICVISGPLFYLAWPKAEYLPPFRRRKWSEMDYIGSFLLIAASTLVVFPFQNASSSSNPWTRAVFLAPLLVGVGCWMALIAWTIVADRRWGGKLAAAFPMQLMRDRVYTAAILNTSCLGFAFIMTIYAFPLRLQVVNGKSALIAGVMLLPLLGSSALGSMVAGAINGRRNWICETLIISSCSVVLGCGLLSTQSASPSVEPKALGFLVFVGLGFGMSAASATMLAHLRATAQDQAPAQGILAQIRILGGSMGIAASSAVLGRHLSGVVDLGQLASIEHHREDYSEDQLQAIRNAFSEAFNYDMWVCAIVSAAGVLLACGVWTRKRRNLVEDQEEVKTSNEGSGVKRR
ncbi:putative MFS multidrug transporter [Sarocladium strictum]